MANLSVEKVIVSILSPIFTIFRQLSRDNCNKSNSFRFL